MKNSVVVAMVLLMIGSASCGVQKREGAIVIPEEDMWVRRVVESGNFTIKVDQAQPMQGQPVFLTSDYSLTIRNDSVFSYLPYYGRVYSAPMNLVGGGLIFNEPSKLMTYVSKEKKGMLITFRVNTNEDNYQFNIQISLNGYAEIDVLSNNRSVIWYRGMLGKK